MDQPGYGLIQTMPVRDGRIPFLPRQLEHSLNELGLPKPARAEAAVRGVVPITSLDGAPAPANPRTAELAGHFWPPA